MELVTRSSGIDWSEILSHAEPQVPCLQNGNNNTQLVCQCCNLSNNLFSHLGFQILLSNVLPNSQTPYFLPHATVSALARPSAPSWAPMTIMFWLSCYRLQEIEAWASLYSQTEADPRPVNKAQRPSWPSMAACTPAPTPLLPNRLHVMTQTECENIPKACWVDK